MKTKLTYLFAVIVLIAVSCKNDKPKDTQDSTKTDQGTDPALLRDSALLDYETAKLYVKNYEAHAGYVDTTSGKWHTKKDKRPNTRCIWFSANRLESILKELREQKGDGIRFYLATYNKKYDDSWDAIHGIKPPQNHWGYNTLIMVPTKDSLAGKEHLHRDYFYNQSTIAGAVKKTISTASAMVSQLQNRGELCPPPSNCKPKGALLIED